MSLSRFTPNPSTVLVALLTTSFLRTPKSRYAIIKRLITFIFLLNWRSWPLVWHVRLWSVVPIIRWNIYTKGVMKSLSIGKSPFETRIVTKDQCTLDQGDWNMHLSNTSYGKALDTARFDWLVQVVGPALGPEQVGELSVIRVPSVKLKRYVSQCWSPLGASSFTFIKEIPILAKYEISVKIITWDDKWIWYAAYFTTDPPKGSTERTLHCIALSQSAFKIKGSRLSIPPGRVLSISGLGPDLTNWDRTMKLRKERKAKKWLAYGGVLAAEKKGKTVSGREKVEGEEGWESDGMECYEEERVRNLALVRQLDGTDGLANLI